MQIINLNVWITNLQNKDIMSQVKNTWINTRSPHLNNSHSSESIRVRYVVVVCSSRFLCCCRSRRPHCRWNIRTAFITPSPRLHSQCVCCRVIVSPPWPISCGCSGSLICLTQRVSVKICARYSKRPLRDCRRQEQGSALCLNSCSMPICMICSLWLWENSGVECRPKMRFVTTVISILHAKVNVNLFWDTCS